MTIHVSVNHSFDLRWFIYCLQGELVYKGDQIVDCSPVAGDHGWLPHLVMILTRSHRIVVLGRVEISLTILQKHPTKHG